MAPQFWSKTILQGMGRGIRRTSGLNKEKEVAVAYTSFIWGRCFDRVACRKSITAGDLPEAVDFPSSKKGRRGKERLGERRRERKFTC